MIRCGGSAWFSICSKCPDRPPCYACGCVSTENPNKIPSSDTKSGSYFKACPWKSWYPAPAMKCAQCNCHYDYHYSIASYKKSKAVVI